MVGQRLELPTVMIVGKFSNTFIDVIFACVSAALHVFDVPVAHAGLRGMPTIVVGIPQRCVARVHPAPWS